MLAATISTPISAPVIAPTRLRGGNAASAAAQLAWPPRHRHRAAGRLHRDDRRPDGLGVLQGSGDRRHPPRRRAVLGHLCHERQHPRRYRRGRLDPDGRWDDQRGPWVSGSEAAETRYTAFASKKGKAVTARLIARRVRDLNKQAGAGQDELSPVWRCHAVFTGSPFELIQAEDQHRGRAVVEQVFAGVTSGPLAHLPSGVFTAKAAWLAIAAMAHNVLRAGSALASLPFTKARAATIRRDLIAVAARTARHGRGRLTPPPARRLAPRTRMAHRLRPAPRGLTSPAGPHPDGRNATQTPAPGQDKPQKGERRNIRARIHLGKLLVQDQTGNGLSDRPVDRS